MSDRLQLPPERDFGFYQRRKHDKWRAVTAPEPALEVPVGDTHAHIHMLPEPAWEIARCAANGVGFVSMIVDPSEDGTRPFDELDRWMAEAAELLPQIPRDEPGREGALPTLPEVCISVGVHPHNAQRFDDQLEETLATLLGDPRVAALGEIGLDFFYDLSPREVQREVFRRQLALAKQAGLPVALHLRGGQDPEHDNAHAEAFSILSEEGFPERGTLVHCCSLPPDELASWIEAGCYIAYGGALTFKNNEAAREGARTVPLDRLLLETDSPYMAPEPMRGVACTPAHVVFTAARLAEVHGAEPGPAREVFFRQIAANTEAFFSTRRA